MKKKNYKKIKKKEVCGKWKVPDLQSAELDILLGTHIHTQGIYNRMNIYWGFMLEN